MALFLFNKRKEVENTMRKLIMLSVAILIVGLLAGCFGITTPETPETDETGICEIEVRGTKGLYGVFDLTGYNSNIVNSAMASYDHPSEIVSYMASHFTKVPSHTVAWSPEEFYRSRWGDCNDFSTYGIYCAYKCAEMPKSDLFQVYIKYTNGKAHMLALYALYPTFPEFNYGYSSNQYYYHDASFYNWVQVVRHHDSQVSATVNYADLYNYDLQRLERRYF